MTPSTPDEEYIKELDRLFPDRYEIVKSWNLDDSTQSGRIPLHLRPDFIPLRKGDTLTPEQREFLFPRERVDLAFQRLAVFVQEQRIAALQQEAQAAEKEALETEPVSMQHTLASNSSDESNVRRRRARASEGMKRAIGKGRKKQTPTG